MVEFLTFVGGIMVIGIGVMYSYKAGPRVKTFDHDTRCKLCVGNSDHGSADHDEAIFESYRGQCEP